MDKEETIKKLEDFNKYAKELENMRFNNQILNSSYSLRIDKVNNFIRTERKGPDDEAIKAFVNDLRRFFQQKGDDTLKIHSLFDIYKSEIVESSERQKFDKIMSEFEKYKKKSICIIMFDENLTNQNVYDVFMYGKFSHRTKGMIDIHDKWEEIKEIYSLLKYEFINILHIYRIFLNKIVYVNNQVLMKL